MRPPYKRQYRLPNQTFTYDVEKYLAAWRRLAQKAVSFFPGFLPTAFDPDLYLERRATDDEGRYRVLDRVVLSVSAVAALVPPSAASRAKADAACELVFGEKD